MNFLGIGTLEFAMILLIGVLVVGPVDMIRFARKAGAMLGQLRRSELWQSIMGSRQAMNRVGRELMGGTEGDLDAIRRELSQIDFTQGADPKLMKDFPGAKSPLDVKSESRANGQSPPAVGEPTGKAEQKETPKKVA